MDKTSKAIQQITQRNVELVAKIESASKAKCDWGDYIADSVAFGIGSWTFLIFQSIVLLIWLTLNLIGWREKWDPYPFILLNLILSFQAAYATPIILMSQNRQSKLSEQRNQLDLQINLLAEQENTEQLRLLRSICEKLNIPMDDLEKALEEVVEPTAIIEQITACSSRAN